MSEAKENMARYHKHCRITICSCKTAEEQKNLCKFWEEANPYVPWNEYCEWWNRMEIVIIEQENEEFRHCRNPDAQAETYTTTRLQI